MNIRKVRYRNFYSARDITVNFDDYEGITVIDGSNGSGKSILFEKVQKNLWLTIKLVKIAA